MAENHSLSFADIIIHQPDLAEVIVHDGVEIDVDMVKEYHEFLLARLKHPFGLLINKKHRYTYTFEAQLSIAVLAEIKAMAVVVYSDISKKATQSLRNMPNHTQWNMDTFDNKEEAMAWLLNELARH